MTVILREIPGLTLGELVNALKDMAGPDVEIETGYGGVVVDELQALHFLVAYTIATGDAEPSVASTTAEQEQPPAPSPKPAKAGGANRRKKEAGEP